ncbi:MAG: Gfo/Idh/MocA family oxidoreductase [Alphaproteobacteria bacterium]|nr:Gfo/Idh/MocA family oxidoreductase [Alphaproteobacteria bacterium]
MIKAGITGLGWWAQNRVRAGTNSNIQFTASTVRNAEKAKEAAEKYDLEIYTSLDKMLETDIEAVCVSTVNTRHDEDIAKALEAGKHVLVEKPLCLTYEGAKKVTDMAAEKGLVLAVGHNRRFHPSIIEIRKRIADGYFGTLLHIQAYENIPMALQMPSDNWRATREEWPAAGMAPLGMHQIDHVIDLCGRFDTIYAQSVRLAVTNDVDDTASLSFKLENGMTGSIATITATAVGMGITIFGSKAAAEIVGRTYGTLTFRPVGGDPEVITYDFDFVQDPIASIAAEQQSFADAIGGKAPFHISPADALHSIEALQAIVNSASSGQPVAIGDITG